MENPNENRSQKAHPNLIKSFQLKEEIEGILAQPEVCSPTLNNFEFFLEKGRSILIN